MNKFLAKGIASALLITTIAGGMVLAPINQDVNAASNINTGVIGTNRTCELCTHTKIEAIQEKTASRPIYVHFTVKTSNGKNYSHIHKHDYTTYNSAPNGQDYFVECSNDDLYTMKNGYHYRTYICTGFRNSTRKYERAGECYIKPVTQARYSSTPTTQYSGKIGFPKCSECKLNRITPNGSTTFQCPLCTAKVTYNPSTAKFIKS